MKKIKPVESISPLFTKEELPSDWDLAPINDICLPVDKVNPKDNPDHEFQYIDISGVDNIILKIAQTKKYFGKDAPSRARQLVQSGDIVFSTVRTYLRNIACVPEKLDGQIASTGFCVLRALKPELKKYLFYYVQYEKFLNELAKFQRGTSYPAVRDGDVFAQFIPVPPLKQADRIVAEIEKQFSRLDEAVANLKRVKANLKRYKAAVLKAAVEGKLTEEWRKQHPDVEPAAKLLERILAERRQKWEEAELAKMKAKGKVPKDDKWKKKYKTLAGPKSEGLPALPSTWTWATPAQLASWVDYSLAIGPFGSNLKVSDYRDKGVPLVFVRNIRTGDFEGENTKYVTTPKAKELKAHAINGGDILITKMGAPPGDACLYPVGQPLAIITADCIKWTLSPYLPGAEFFVNAINSQLLKAQILQITKGVAQQKVSLARFKEIAVPLPPQKEQRAILDEVGSRLSVIDGVKKIIDSNLRRSERLRQSILSKAFSGQLLKNNEDLQETA